MLKLHDSPQALAMKSIKLLALILVQALTMKSNKPLALTLVEPVVDCELSSWKDAELAWCKGACIHGMIDGQAGGSWEAVGSTSASSSATTSSLLSPPPPPTGTMAAAPLPCPRKIER